MNIKRVLNAFNALVALLVCQLIFVFYKLVLDYDASWMHPEMNGYIQNAIHNGRGFSFRDLLLSMDWLHFDGAPRVRFASNLLLIVNTKLRLYFLSIIPLHPSISLHWIIFFLLSPFFLYKSLTNLTDNKRVALIAVCIYLMTPSSLATLNFLYHPAKPLANFLFIFIIWMASRAIRAKKSSFTFSALLGSILFFACLVDEALFFLYLLVPILLKDFLRSDETSRKYLLVAYFLSGIAFLVAVSFAFPLLIDLYGVGNFNFWSWAVTSNNRLLSLTLLRPFYENSVNLIWGHLVPFKGQYAAFNFGPAVILGVVAVSLFFAVRFFRFPAQTKRLVVTFLVLLFSFIFFQTLLLTRHLSIIKDSYYYGGPVSVFLAILLALVCGSKESDKDGSVLLYLSSVLVPVYLVIILAYNYMLTNAAWRGKIDSEPTITRTYVREFWEKRFDRDYLNSVGPTIKPRRFESNIQELLLISAPTPPPWNQPLSPYMDPSIPQQ